MLISSSAADPLLLSLTPVEQFCLVQPHSSSCLTCYSPWRFNHLVPPDYTSLGFCFCPSFSYYLWITSTFPKVQVPRLSDTSLISEEEHPQLTCNFYGTLKDSFSLSLNIRRPSQLPSATKGPRCCNLKPLCCFFLPSSPSLSLPFSNLPCV